MKTTVRYKIYNERGYLQYETSYKESALEMLKILKKAYPINFYIEKVTKTK